MLSLYSGVAAAFLSLVAAQTTTTTGSSATASLWLPLDLSDVGNYAASVVNICSDTTTYTMACASDCLSYPPVFTVTAASDVVQVKYETSTDGVMLSISESCNIASSTSASCSGTVSASVNGKQTGTATSVEYSGADYTNQIYQLPVTAGADKTSSQGTCTGGAIGNAAPIIFSAAGVFALVAAIML